MNWPPVRRVCSTADRRQDFAGRQSPRKGLAKTFHAKGGIVAAECARLDIEG
uniref:Uncharacterized protein n=1 Tax=Anopheles merus TaxID=30066 RepID=A0A182VMG4_ANOME